MPQFLLQQASCSCHYRQRLLCEAIHLSMFNNLPPVSFNFITHDSISELVCFVLCGLLGLLLTSGENVMSTSPL